VVQRNEDHRRTGTGIASGTDAGLPRRLIGKARHPKSYSEPFSGIMARGTKVYGCCFIRLRERGDGSSGFRRDINEGAREITRKSDPGFRDDPGGSTGESQYKKISRPLRK